MKIGRSLNDLAAELYRQAQTKKDYIADTRALNARVNADDQVVLEGIGDGMLLRSTAHAQLANALGIPKTYYDRLMSNAPDLLVKNVNHWLQKEPERKLVRTLDDGIRAILSDRYRPLDNIDVAEAVLPHLQRLGGEVISGQITDGHFYLKASTPRIRGEVAVGDMVQTGVVISNSEIGDGSLRVDEMTYRLVCLNGAIHGQAVRKNHIGRKHDADELSGREFYRDETRQAEDKAFFLKVRDTVSNVLSQDRLDRNLEAMRGAKEKKIEVDPCQVVECAAKRFGLGEFERGSILKHLIEGSDLSVFGLSNALTRASQDVESYEMATAMEAAGGRILELSRKDWNELLSV